MPISNTFSNKDFFNVEKSTLLLFIAIHLLILVLLFGFIPVVYAENFASFTVTTSFSNEIDVTQIPSIYVLISVPGEEDYREIELTRDNMFNYDSKEMPNSDIQFDSAYIAGDRYGKYKLDGDLKRTDSNTATLTISVFLNNGSVTTSTTTTARTTTVYTSQVNSPDDVIIVDDNGNVRTTASVTTTTASVISDAAKARLELYKYIFIGIGIFVVIVVFLILVKIVRTNNLM